MLKKIIYLIVSGGLLLSGCSLDYEPLNGPSSGSFPASEEEAMAGLYAAYKGLANMTVKETPFPMRINDCISDIGTYRTGAGNQIKAMSSTLTADNTMCEKVYKTVYKIAGRVHLVLDNLDRLRGVIPEDRFNQIKAELLCIRAYYYDLGCQFYGDIPFIDHQLDLDDYSDYPRIPREQVTARLLQDLDDDLLDYLPVQWNPGTYGTTRIGRVAAYALKARIALNWGLWEEAARCSKIATTLAEGVYDLEPLDCTYYATHADGEPSAANHLDAIEHNTITLGIGPAGTGKTYLAVAEAVAAFRAEKVNRIILTRPAVEAGERLGFLPGDLQSKVDPYLRPLYDALFEMLGADTYAKYLERGNIEVAPLAYMRGRTLDDSFIILDEAQNTSREQMKMFLTRIGFGSHVVITGDVTQIDLPPDKTSGLKEAMRVLDGIEDIAICRLSASDVVRHALVQKIIEAYEKNDRAEAAKADKPAPKKPAARTTPRKKA